MERGGLVRQIETPQLALAEGPVSPASGGIGDQINLVTGFLRRRWRTLIICFLLCLPVGLLYAYFAPRVYTATAVMLIETHKSSLADSLLGNAPQDAAWIESQIGILRSQNVAAHVVRTLRLAEDPKFVRAEPLDNLLARLGWAASAPNTEAERVGTAIVAVMKDLNIRRVGPSYMVQINFRAHHPEHAVKVANAMVDAYVFDQLNAKYQASRRSGDWLQERLQTLREQAATAERAVLEFKAKNNMVKTGGTLMNEKQLSEMSNQLATVRAKAADLQTRLERVAAVRQAYQREQPRSGIDETVSEAMSNAIISRLHNQYLDLVNREADWSVRYGKNHNAVVNLRNQIGDIRRSIRDELGRIEETFKSEYQIAKKQQDEAEKALGGLISQSSETNHAQIALFSLEAAAQSYRKLYDSFLQRHTETVQGQSFPITDARLISPASVTNTGPQFLQIGALTMLAGVMLGAGLGVFRELMDRGIRTRDQVRSVLDAECLALIPILPKLGVLRGVEPDFAARPRIMRTLPMPMADRGETIRRIRPHAMVWPSIVDEPSSPCAEAIRSLKLTLDLKSETASPHVLGLTSCLPGEGKTTIAAAMAASIAKSGASVLLVDCDLRNPSLSRAMAPDAKVGFLEVADGKVALTDAIWHDPATKLDFLPTVIIPLSAIRTDVFASIVTESFFKTLQIKYDLVIVDLAPLIVGVDVRATLRHIDCYLLVIEWGATKIDDVRYALRHAPGVQENIAGVLLNKVDMASMKLYDNYGSHYYYGRSPPN